MNKSNSYKNSGSSKLISIKIVHTLIWLFFNGVIIYLFYAVIVNRIDKWVWIGIGFILLETIVLLIFKLKCPLTVWARKYSNSQKHNFDIYLPEWLATYNKEIYSALFTVFLLMLLYRLL
ncbi:MAG: hypothetical protein WAU23_14140 [Ferruginibacter sp.]